MAKRRTTAWRRVVALVGWAMLAASTVTATGCAGGDSTDRGTPPAPTVTGVGFTDFRASNPQVLTREHRTGRLTYAMSPPVGGDHNPVWQDCNGEIYASPVPSERAVHSLEHGAVWITYRPGLPPDDIARLAAKVRDRTYLFLSPYPGLDAPISVQAWGYQLKVNAASDKRIDDFIRAYRMTASLEPGASCSGGTSATS